MDIINDPSHIAGNRELLPYVCQKALDLNMEGLMIESHMTPSVAWSDAAQQVTPAGLTELLDGLLKTAGPAAETIKQIHKLSLPEETTNEIQNLSSPRDSSRA